MPHTTYGLLKAIRSHEIDSPRDRAEVSPQMYNHILAWLKKSRRFLQLHPPAKATPTRQGRARRPPDVPEEQQLDLFG